MAQINDIGVLGSGPSALVMAAACSRVGASVTLVAPHPRERWRANYCMWADELPSGMEDFVEHAWPEVLVATSQGERHLGRSYVKLDSDALQDFYWSQLRDGVAQIIAEPAVAVTHGDGESSIHAPDGRRERVRLVIDASGSRTPLVARSARRSPAFQVAYGVLLDAPSHPFDPRCAVLMDFRPATPDSLDPPTFLYGLPLSDGRLFLEETSLAHRPGVARETLRNRLEARLQSLGLQGCPRLDEEHCRIAMGVALPAPTQRLVPFGAAASMVHPASGYSIAHMLRKANPVARAIVHALASHGVSAAIDAGNAVVWPPADRAAWELYGIGLESLVRMGAEETTAFFDGFFRLGQDDWAGFLGGTLRPGQVATVMTRLFRHVPLSVGWQLVRTSLSIGAAPLAKTFLQPAIS
jgi:lycopene beta-cyclase